MAKILPFPKKPEKSAIEPRVSQVQRAVSRLLHKHKPFIDTQLKQKIAAGTHRFDIHPGQAVCLKPQGFLLDREEDRLKRLAQNAAAIELWDNRYVEVTDDGFVVREYD